MGFVVAFLLLIALSATGLAYHLSRREVLANPSIAASGDDVESRADPDFQRAFFVARGW